GLYACLGVGVFIIAFKEGRAAVDDYEIDTAELIDFGAEQIHFSRQLEPAAAKVDGNCSHIEVHLLRHRDPAHLDVDIVLAREIKHPALLDFEIAEHFAQTNVSGE